MKAATATNPMVWHQLHTEQVIQFLDVSLRTGLAHEEVRRRQIIHLGASELMVE